MTPLPTERRSRKCYEFTNRCFLTSFTVAVQTITDAAVRETHTHIFTSDAIPLPLDGTFADLKYILTTRTDRMHSAEK